MTSLFKAVQDVKNIFKDRSKYRIFPVIFLRDDIYEIILDADKNKWNDFKIELNWDTDKIQRLVAFRITRALDPHATKILPFAVAWERLLGRDQLGIGTKQSSLMLYLSLENGISVSPTLRGFMRLK